MKISKSAVISVIGTQLFVTGCVALGYYSYSKVMEVDQPEYRTPRDNSMKIELLEIGIKNHVDTIKTCQETLAYNKDRFNNYVSTHKDLTSRTNYSIIRKDREIERLNTLLRLKTSQVENLRTRLNNVQNRETE